MWHPSVYDGDGYCDIVDAFKALAVVNLEGELPGRRPDAEFVPIGVGELRPFAPRFSARLFGKSDTTSFERCTGSSMLPVFRI